MLDWIDFLFWTTYCFCTKHHVFLLYHKDKACQSIRLITLNSIIISTYIYTYLEFYLNSFSELKISFFILLVASLVSIWMDHRYTYNTKIVNGDYHIFRKQWSETPSRHKRKYLSVVAFYIVPLLLFIYEVATGGILKKWGIA